jgi:hypothetical protein
VAIFGLLVIIGEIYGKHGSGRSILGWMLLIWLPNMGQLTWFAGIAWELTSFALLCDLIYYRRDF